MPETPRFLSVYYRSRHWRVRLLAGALAAFDGFWLGVLSPKQLGQLDDAFYRATREAHGGRSLGYADAAYTRRGLEPWEQDVLGRTLAPGSRVLVTGAGGGREVLALVRDGHDAEGFEPNELLVEHGEATMAEDGHPGRLHLMRRDGFPEVAGTWDAVLVGWGSYMSIVGRDARIAFLRAARARLGAGDPVIVSAWSRGETTPHDLQVARVGSAVRRLLRRPPVEVGDTLADSYVHRFTREELEDEVRAAGFEPVDFGDDPFAWVVARAA